MKIVCISDTHGFHDQVKIPNGDMLLIAGDITKGTIPSTKKFNEWLGTLPHQYKVMIAGNHDWIFQKNKEKIPELITNAIYLEETDIEIEGLKIWGSPWTPWFLNWAFNIPPGYESDYWKNIPSNTDILITHGPPRGILDYVPKDHEHAGCKELLKKVFEIKPKIHVFGHLHSNHGIKEENETKFINATICNEDYKPINEPIIIEAP
jgi:Icc-related predicted phosphoesterase